MKDARCLLRQHSWTTDLPDVVTARPDQHTVVCRRCGKVTRSDAAGLSQHSRHDANLEHWKRGGMDNI